MRIPCSSYAPASNLLASIEGPVHAVSDAYEDNRNLMTTVAAWNPTFDYDKIGNPLWSVGVSPNAYTVNASIDLTNSRGQT